jgi:hypothetical protein
VVGVVDTGTDLQDVADDATACISARLLHRSQLCRRCCNSGDAYDLRDSELGRRPPLPPNGAHVVFADALATCRGCHDETESAAGA